VNFDVEEAEEFLKLYENKKELDLMDLP